MKPSDEALELIHEWLLENNIHQSELEYSAARDSIKFSLAVEEAERLLNTEYSIYEHEDGTRLVRTTKYSLPAYLHEHVSIVTPTNQWLRSDPRSDHVRSLNEGAATSTATPDPADVVIAAVCDFGLVTPDCLRTIYGTINYTAQVPGKNKIALNDFLGEINVRTDILQFLQIYRPEASSAAHTFEQISIAGGPINQALNSAELGDGKGVEGNLDTETILGKWDGNNCYFHPHGQPTEVSHSQFLNSLLTARLTFIDVGISWPTPLSVYS